LWVTCAQSQAYPAKPIRILVLSAGGPPDFVARTLAQHLTPVLGQQVIVENRPGAGGTIAAAAVAKSPPDGYTLLLASTTTLSISPSLFANPGFDTMSFAPISLIATAPFLVVGQEESSWPSPYDPEDSRPRSFEKFATALVLEIWCVGSVAASVAEVRVLAVVEGVLAEVVARQQVPLVAGVVERVAAAVVARVERFGVFPAVLCLFVHARLGALAEQPAEPSGAGVAMSEGADEADQAVTGEGIELEIQKGLPLAGGLGGSAASAVAGAVAADALLGSRLEPEALLERALEAEAVVAGRHPDNAAPSLLGGAVVVLGTSPLRYTRLSVHPSLRLVFVTPGYGVRTAHARSVLPESVSRGDAVAQAAALAALVLGLERGDGALLRSAIRDRIAEPSRIPLYPGFERAREAALAAGAFGAAVSGAGPTLLAIVSEPRAHDVARAVAESYASEGIATAATHVAGVDDRGARVE
jgi:homoserine kinase